MAEAGATGVGIRTHGRLQACAQARCGAQFCVAVLSTRTQLWLGAILTVASLVAAPGMARAQTLNQCRNGDNGNVDCTGSAWHNGNLNASNSLYRENDFVPFRMYVGGLTVGHSYTVRIGYDALEGGLHAYDYLGSYDASRRPGQAIVPCDGIANTTGCNDPPDELTVPIDTHTGMPGGIQRHGVFSAWGANLTGAVYVAPTPTIDQNSTGTIARRIDLTFTARGPVVVIAWGGHIASILDWGPDRTFAEVGTGSPFHMRVENAHGFSGTGDLSIQAAAVPPRPTPFTTQVSAASVPVGTEVIDTARLGGSAPRPAGTVRFWVCGPEPAGPPDCTLNGDPVGDRVVDVDGTSAIPFTPEAEGFYCFRAEYVPAPSAPYSPAVHTDLVLGGECLNVTTPPPPPGPGTLTVIKHCVPPGDRGRFRVTITGEGQTIRRTLRCGGETEALKLAPGTYHVTERGVGGTNLANYDREIGGNCDSGGRVVVAEGEPATCTINNIRRPKDPRLAHLTLHKLCAPSTDAGRFNLRVDGVTLPDAHCGAVVGPLALRPGTYHVSESAGTGTDLSAYTTVIGGACAADGSVTLGARESATCTITNVRLGTPTAVLTVVKECDPAGDDGRFTLAVDEHEFSGMRCGQSTGPITVATGTRLVGEVATPGVAENYDTAFGGDCAAIGTITLAAGQQATCSVTNTRLRHPPAIRPANVCYTLAVSPRRLRAGRAASVVARAAVRGTPVRGVLVRVAGAGISHSGRTRATGEARFGVLPRSAGRIAVTTPRQFGCPAVLPKHIVVRGLRPIVTG
jgi:hypothetical protein